MVAEEFGGGRARFGDTVRKSEENVAGVENCMPGQVICFGQHSDCRATGFQHLLDALRSNDQSRVVAGIDIAEFAGGGIKDAKKEGRKHAQAVVI